MADRQQRLSEHTIRSTTNIWFHETKEDAQFTEYMISIYKQNQNNSYMIHYPQPQLTNQSIDHPNIQQHLFFQNRVSKTSIHCQMGIDKKQKRLAVLPSWIDKIGYRSSFSFPASFSHK